MFSMNSTIANYADDNTPYTTAKDIESSTLFKCLSSNILIPNPSKPHMLLSCPNLELFANIDGNKIFNSKREKLLGIIIDNELKCYEHVSNTCKKASNKLHALSRISNFMTVQKRRIVMKSFIEPQFGYCPLVWMFSLGLDVFPWSGCFPLVWMFCGKSLDNRINRIHERSLRVVYNDYRSNFIQLLERDGSMTIHHRI